MRARGLLNQSGQVAVLVALLATALLSTLALVVDVGSAYEGRRELQNSVDAAALAGAMDIAEDRGSDAAVAAAEEYMLENVKEPVANVAVSFPDNTKVKVEADATRQTFFARLFGRDSVAISAKATASLGAASKIYNLMPFIVPQQRIPGHIGPENPGTFELGEDRPLEDLSIIYAQDGERVTYTVTYVNSGNTTVDIEMWSPIPAGATYVDGSVTAGGTFDGTVVRWQWTDIIAGDSRMAEYTVEFGGAVDPTNEVFAAIDGGKTESASTQNSQRGFFWLTDFDSGSGGTPEFEDWIINGYPEAVGIGDLANGTGVRSSLKAAMEQRIATDPSVILPLYDYTEGGGSKGQYHVVGFAEFVMTGFSLTGNPKAIEGYFTNGTVTPGVGGGEPPADFGVKAIWLSD